MVQIPGTVGGVEKGLTTIDQHEINTWGPATAGAAAVTKPSSTEMPTILTFMKAIRDRRKEN